MNDKLNPPMGQVLKIRDHDCFDWHTRVLGFNGIANYTMCGVCKKVTDWLPRSRWQRIKNVFRK